MGTFNQKPSGTSNDKTSGGMDDRSLVSWGKQKRPKAVTILGDSGLSQRKMGFVKQSERKGDPIQGQKKDTLNMMHSIQARNLHSGADAREGGREPCRGGF